MKCVNCGGEVASNQQYCPYCNSTNHEWVKQQKLLEKLAKRNENLVIEVIEEKWKYVVNKVCNIALIVTAAVLVCSLVLSLIAYQYTTGAFKLKPTDYKAVLEQYYEAGEYEKLYQYLSDYNLFGVDNYTYSQMALLDYDYNYFSERMFACVDSINNGSELSDFDLEYAISYGYSVLFPNFFAYPDIDERNKPKLKEYPENVRGFFKAYFKLTDAEIDSRLNKDEYHNISNTDIKLLMSEIRGRVQKNGNIK